MVGTYRYKGEVYEVTARDAILGSGSLSTARRSDGSYETPSTDEIVSYARNNILAQLVKDNGIEVSADEVAQYAMNLVGTSDADAVAVLRYGGDRRPETFERGCRGGKATPDRCGTAGC